MTNALNIASELAVRPGIKLITTGGVARSQSYELSGPIAEASLTGLNLNVAFIGVDGIDAQAGCTTHHEVEAHTNAVMIGCARRVVVVADSSKIGKVAFARICEVGESASSSPTPPPTPDAVRALTDAGVQGHAGGRGAPGGTGQWGVSRTRRSSGRSARLRRASAPSTSS